MNQSFDRALGTLEQWARERGISTNGTVEGQAKKTIEEAGEILDAQAVIEQANRGMKTASQQDEKPEYEDARTKRMVGIAELEDALGDTGVTWIMTCICAKRDPVEMLFKAIEEIQDRRGYMGTDGIFYKENADYAVRDAPISNEDFEKIQRNWQIKLIDSHCWLLVSHRHSDSVVTSSGTIIPRSLIAEAVPF